MIQMGSPSAQHYEEPAVSLTKRLLASLVLATAAALPASAQSFADRSSTETAVFLRIPFGSRGAPKEARDIRFGLALNMGCRSSLALPGAGAESCSSAPLRSMELGGGPAADWTLSFASAGRLADIASFSTRTGMLSFAGDGAGNADWLWIGIAAAGGIALTAKLIDDGDFVICSGDGATVGNGGTCN
jgi:hypothetical protein